MASQEFFEGQRMAGVDKRYFSRKVGAQKSPRRKRLMAIYQVENAIFQEIRQDNRGIYTGGKEESEDVLIVYRITPFVDTVDEFVFFCVFGEKPGENENLVTLAGQADGLFVEDAFRPPYYMFNGDIGEKEDSHVTSPR